MSASNATALPHGAGSHADTAPPRKAGTAGAKDSKPSYALLYRHLWHFAHGARLRLLLATALLVSSQVLKLGVPYLAGQAINAIQAGGDRMLWNAGSYIAAVLGAFVASWVLHGPGRIIERSVGVHVRTRVADALYARASRLPLAWHNRHHSGEVLHRVGHSRRTSSSTCRTSSTSAARSSRCGCCRTRSAARPSRAICWSAR